MNSLPSFIFLENISFQFIAERRCIVKEKTKATFFLVNVTLKLANEVLTGQSAQKSSRLGKVFLTQSNASF